MAVTQETRLDIRPQSGWTGAEIRGADLSQPLGQATVAEIREALLQWKVVFFRDQQLDHAAHIRFGQYFGEVTPGHQHINPESLGAPPPCRSGPIAPALFSLSGHELEQ